MALANHSPLMAGGRPITHPIWSTIQGFCFTISRQIWYNFLRYADFNQMGGCFVVRSPSSEAELSSVEVLLSHVDKSPSDHVEIEQLFAALSDE